MMQGINQNKTNYRILGAFILGFILFSSCVTQKHVEYLKKNPKDTYTNTEFTDYKLKENDELYIQISSLDESAATVFNSGGSNQSLGNLNPFGASLMSHTIDKDGYLELPVIGRIEAKDKTIAQVRASIKESLTNILNQPLITVKLVNRYVSVLGEVRNPGHFVYSREKLSIFDAVGLAGDITDYGNRKSVILIRNDGKINQRVQLNLLDSDILGSEYYFLKPGDIVYVKPLQNKFWGLRQFPFGVFLSSITTTILVLNYLN